MTATLLAEPLTPGSPEWLQTISASKVAAILGISPWATPYSLWHAMAGTTPPEEQTQVQADGHYWEPHIREWYAAAHDDWNVCETSTWRNDQRAWQTADPDGLVYRTDGTRLGLEIKAVHDYLGAAGWGKPGTDEVPDYYRVQAVWQMDTIGYERTVFAVCGFRELMERKPAEYVVEYDPAEAAELRRIANAFRMSIAMGVEPRADYARDEDYRALKWKYRGVTDGPKDNPGVDIPDEIAVPWLEALLAADRAAEAEARTRSDLVAFLGDGKAAQWGNTLLGTRRRTTPPSFSKAKGLDPAALLSPTRTETAA